MTDWTHRTTERLSLSAVSAADVDDLYALNSDPRVWRHLPSARHTERSRTVEQTTAFAAAWQRDGLGYWTVRAGGQFAGVGGCTVKAGVGWNVYYRLRPEMQGNGYAGEMTREAMRAATEVNGELPVFAYLLEHNHASRAVAESVGLELVWRGPDSSDPDSIRLIFADRPLAADALVTLTALP